VAAVAQVTVASALFPPTTVSAAPLTAISKEESLDLPIST